MKKLLLFAIMLALVGCGKNPCGPGSENQPLPQEDYFVMSGTTSLDFMFVSSKTSGGMPSEEHYDLKNSYDWHSNFPIKFTSAQYDNSIDYSKFTPQIWVDKQSGTIRMVGCSGKRFEVGYYYLEK